MNNRYGKGRFNGPIFKLQPKSFDFDTEKADLEEDYLKNKMKEIGVPGARPIKRSFYEQSNFGKIKKPTVENEYLQHTLSNNPYYVIPTNEKIIHQDKDKKELINELKMFNKTIGESSVDFNNEKNASFITGLNFHATTPLADLGNGTTASYVNESVAGQDFFEKNDLQGTKSLGKYDCWDDDLTPEQWVEACQQNPENTHAKAPFYENEKYIWLPVKVLEYDANKKKFLVKVVERGIQKHVDRLSLLFDKEDKTKFKERVQLCKYYQKRAEDEIRFQNYAENITDDKVSHLNPEWEKAIQSKVLNKKSMKEEEYNNGLFAFKKVIRTVEAEYLRQMKRCIVMREMMDKEMTDKFQSKRIKLRKNKKIVPHLGIIGKILPQSRYNGFDSFFNFMRESLKQRHISKTRKLIEAVNIFSNRNSIYVTYKLFDTNSNTANMPFDLNGFIENQKAFHEGALKSLNIQWREYLVTEVADVIRSPNFP